MSDPADKSDRSGESIPAEPHKTTLVRVEPSDEDVDPGRVGPILGTLVSSRDKIGVLVVKRDSELVYGFSAERCDKSFQSSIERAFPDSYWISKTEIELPLPQEGSTRGVRYLGVGERPMDYLTPLEAAAGTDPSDPIDSKPIALPNLLKELISKQITGVYQALITEPKALAEESHEYARRMKHSTPSWIGKLRRDQARLNDNREPIRRTHPSYQRRIDRIEAQNLVPTLAVNARLVLSGPRSEQRCDNAVTAFRSISTPFYKVSGGKLDNPDAHDLYSEICNMTMDESLPTNIPGLRWIRSNKTPCLITSVQSVLHFSLIDGGDTQPKLARALGQHDEGDSPPRPPSEDELDEYR